MAISNGPVLVRVAVAPHATDARRRPLVARTLARHLAEVAGAQELAVVVRSDGAYAFLAIAATGDEFHDLEEVAMELVAGVRRDLPDEIELICVSTDDAAALGLPDDAFRFRFSA